MKTFSQSLDFLAGSHRVCFPEFISEKSIYNTKIHTYCICSPTARNNSFLASVSFYLLPVWEQYRTCKVLFTFYVHMNLYVRFSRALLFYTRFYFKKVNNDFFLVGNIFWGLRNKRGAQYLPGQFGGNNSSGCWLRKNKIL